GAVDRPNERKIHNGQMPRMGGLSIFLGFFSGFLYLWPTYQYALPILVGALLMTSVGFLDDKYNLSPRSKFFGQIIAALVVVQSG
ncbi:undecaprenyl/decaprenyl-phosphate alpha-N-acetylglucosaminyl 1-phosphate transferase, partial [Klebsiella michiganensis]